ncbi:MAG TPA: hypothetical protein VGC41_24260 [Kofleriaceae bacterium]
MRHFAMVLVCLAACATDGGGDDSGATEDGQLAALPQPGKEDGQYHAGLATNVDSSRTDVWKVTRQWEDKDAAAGMAWSANSGLTWDEKFSKWVGSFEWTPSVDGYSTTVKITTPFGKTLPAPELECAETALWLRITFAAWYGLPLQFEAQDDHGTRMFFGHFGIRTANGNAAGMPEFAVKYKDYSANQPATWPQDATLRTRIIHGGDDNQEELAPGASFGQYMDEMHLNKRVGYFTVIALDYLGSMNLADASNTYNLNPDALRPGDILLERWQKDGIGHTLVVKDVAPLANATFDATLISGSMPRRQGVKASGSSAKNYFTGDYTGGPGANSDGDEYAKLGGGLKRFRVAKARNGYWTNTWMAGDEAHWINSTDYAAIAARPARFATLLGEIPPDQAKVEILARIDDARHHLSQYPASCAAREQREQAFRDLYEVENKISGKDASAVDAEQRKLEDYVFAQLDYDHSETCCWDSSTAAMYDIVMQEARADKAAADQQQVCTAPVVFASQNGSYQRWADYATSIGKGTAWKPYTDDEGCTAKHITTDTVATSQATAFCSLAP